MNRWLIGALLASVGANARASDKPLYQPVPDWVKPAPAIDPASITDASPVLLMLDNQQRLKDGEVWTYSDTATRIASSETLGQAGTLNLPWQPAMGDLIIHRLEILRGGERIDLLAGGKGFTVLRREQQLEQRQLDGMLTATMAVEGLRVGDILHLVASTTRRDAVLKGQMQGFAGLPALPLRIGFARTRLLWPTATPVHWKTYADGAVPTERETGGYHDLTFTLPLPKQPEMPADAPSRFAKLSVVEASSFADWAGVAAVMAPLYATAGLIVPGSPLAGEVDRIKAASPDQLARTALALQLVQEKVRYLFNGMDQGNYTPQAPAQTWAVRYGDCKAKTVLLLALLRAMDIEAEPVLANSKLGDLLPSRLPSPGAFDHVLVRATIGGETLWLDGTDNGARLADLRDTPPFRYVLPVRAANATLMPVAMRPRARADIDTIVDLDESAGTALPAPLTISITMRGQIAQLLHAAQAQASKDDITRMVGKMTDNLVGSSLIVSRAMTFDETAGTVTVTGAGVAYPQWNRIEERYKSVVDTTIGSLTFDPDRARPAWAHIPVATGNAYHYRLRTRIRLPADGKGFTMEGDDGFTAPIAGIAIHRTVTRDGRLLTVDDSTIATGEEIAPDAIAATRQRVALAKSRQLTAIAPAAYPGPYEQTIAAAKAGQLAKTLALYTQGIADQPDEASSYTNRAWFLERTYDRRKAIDDLTRAIAIKPDIDTYQWRARLYRETGDGAKALADLTAARTLDPGADGTIEQLARLEVERGDKAAALTMIQDRIDAGGKTKAGMIALKADLLARSGDREGALAAMDQAVAASPGSPGLLNSRCWLKGQLNVALDTALKDCTRSIELSDSTSAALDSRALVYFRMNRFDDAMADLTAALDNASDRAPSLYLRGIIRNRQGKPEGRADLAAARAMAPLIDDDYKPYGIMP